VRACVYRCTAEVSEQILELHEQEVQRVQAYYDENRELFEKVGQRERLFAEFTEFEVSTVLYLLACCLSLKLVLYLLASYLSKLARYLRHIYLWSYYFTCVLFIFEVTTLLASYLSLKLLLYLRLFYLWSYYFTCVFFIFEVTTLLASYLSLKLVLYLHIIYLWHAHSTRRVIRIGCFSTEAATYWKRKSQEIKLWKICLR